MSATKPPAGYDDRFVVPLEPSRRGAHRARVSPVIGLLPLVAVVAVVLVVVLLTWTLFGRSNGTSSAGGATAGATPSATVSQQTTPSVPTVTESTPAGTVTTPSGDATTAGDVDKTMSVTVLNSTTRTGLAGRAATLLVGKGWTAAHSAKTPKVTARATTVYYATSSERAAAEALVADLGLGVVKKSSQFGTAGLTVVVGTDYP